MRGLAWRTVGRLNARALVLAAVLVAAAAAIAFTSPQGADYANFDCQLRQPCEDAQPVIDDLISGNYAALWREQGLLGPVSLVWRAPFASLASGTEARYRLGCFACLLVLAAAALLIASEMRRRGKRDCQNGYAFQHDQCEQPNPTTGPAKKPDTTSAPSPKPQAPSPKPRITASAA